jgi:hypothetical protein
VDGVSRFLQNASRFLQISCHHVAKDSILQVEVKFLYLLFICVVPAYTDIQVRVTPVQLMF